MLKGFPRHNLPAKPLREPRLASRRHGLLIVTLATHSCDLCKVAHQVYLQNLECDIVLVVLDLPHVGKPTTIHWGIHRIVAKRDLDGRWKQTTAATNLTEDVQALPPE